MRKRPARLVIAATICLSVVALGGPADARQPQVADPAGDWPHGALDIRAVWFSAEGTGPATRLVVRMTLEAAPSVPGTFHAVRWHARGCRYGIGTWLSARPERPRYAEVWAACGSTFLARGIPVRVVGRDVVWDVPLRYGMRVGTRLTQPTADTWYLDGGNVHGGEPIVGGWLSENADFAGPGRSYVIGRGATDKGGS